MSGQPADANPSRPEQKHSGDRSAHTPGPWRVQRLETEGHFRVVHGWQGSVAGGVVCERRYRGSKPHQGLANARLIAAAPDMLAALQKIVSHPADGFEGEVISMTARAAIDQALGVV